MSAPAPLIGPALARLLAAAPLPAVVAAPDGRLLAFNPAAEQVFGYPGAEALEHLTLLDLFDRDADLEHLREHPDERPRVTLRAADGERIPARLSSARFDGLTMLLVEDLRPTLSLERRLSETSRQLVDAERRAVGSDVGGAAAHHLNQPLTTIMGSVELLTARGDLPRDVHGRLARIYASLQRLSETIQKIASADRGRRTRYVGDHEILEIHEEDPG